LISDGAMEIAIYVTYMMILALVTSLMQWKQN